MANRVLSVKLKPGEAAVMRPRSESQAKLAAAGFSISGTPEVIVANGCGKSTFMKILGGELEAARTVRKG
jgi:ABC-type uncharacterized transport system ATPase subunit